MKKKAETVSAPVYEEKISECECLVGEASVIWL